ncbi:Carnitinyl-CoA dehydratase [Zhongshania aliphaticivorans]|uniref:Carnitinyl-CoA dehydratase n=1 Tax=Zhongshania aliphaticivorans TaxID=1470434 RepID=A0A5S9NVZ0_9GAMM|nr:crotonase/enoyl-CoA hydratase family protein [Zhongshania aliphaticivorans]CAA0094889.1 Carnitinyl-CoA dehydratase [Zhongshania aliphaticivorans]CAA0112738.1 Carnitinyl-CoA dehydratase [Zhongshania aliphaticivorans]
MPHSHTVKIERQPPLLWVTINRPQARNAVDGKTASALASIFTDFDADPDLSVAILMGAEQNFCAGADLKAIASDNPELRNPLTSDGIGPMGPSRLTLSKPVIAAIDGYCVAGGLELALWCDLRVATERAVFGVFCRRFGVPLIDGGTVRLPRLIGMSHAMDMILTGRAVNASEALNIGLANRLVAPENLRATAEELALQIANFPQQCLRNDRQSAYQQWGMNEDAAINNEFQLGLKTLASGETNAGAKRFEQGNGRQGRQEKPPKPQ